MMRGSNDCNMPPAAVAARPTQRRRNHRLLIDYDKPRMKAMLFTNAAFFLPLSISSLVDDDDHSNSSHNSDDELNFCIRKSGLDRRRRERELREDDAPKYKVVYDKQTRRRSLVQQAAPEDAAPTMPKTRRRASIVRSSSRDSLASLNSLRPTTTTTNADDAPTSSLRRAKSSDESSSLRLMQQEVCNNQALTRTPPPVRPFRRGKKRFQSIYTMHDNTAAVGRTTTPTQARSSSLLDCFESLDRMMDTKNDLLSAGIHLDH